MSTLREKTRQIRRKGEADRDDWSPKEGSWTLRVYRWWLKKTGHSATNENFCHFWRVVLIWAPLRWLQKPLLVLLGLAVAAGVIWLATQFTNTTIAVVLGAVGIGYLYLGLVALFQLLEDLGFDVEGVDWLAARPLSVRSLVYVLTLPLLIIAAVVALVFGSIGAFFRGLQTDFNLYDKVWSWLTTAKLSDRWWGRWIRPWQVIPLALLVASHWYAWAGTWLFLVGGFALFHVTIDFAAQREAENRQRRQQEREAQRLQEQEARKLAERRRVDLVLRFIFEAQHRQRADETEDDYEGRWNNWRLRYVTWFQRTYEFDSVYDLPAWSHAGMPRHRKTKELVMRRFERFENEQFAKARVSSQVPVSAPKPPGRVQKFFWAIGDFFSFIWAVILAMKWRTCPWVKIPVEEPKS